MVRRSYLKLEWCIAVIEKPLRREVQADGRVQFWGMVEEMAERHPNLHGRALKVVTLSDGVTIHTAYPDRNFKVEENAD
ncbi:MAG: hypothetical protein GEU75_09500 [Dehalococcoidia bacterium]|nr:hypothetical protein [Dehalococcoidia bacterium]